MMSATSRGFRTTDRIDVPDEHFRRCWRSRHPEPEPDKRLEEAWREADPLAWPGPHNALYARLHRPSGLVLVAQRAEILRVWPVAYFRKGRDELERQVNYLSGYADD